MKSIKEITIILLLMTAGLIIQKMVSFPSSLASMILFLVLLLTGVIREEIFKGGLSDLILRNLSIFFLPPTVRIIESYQLIQGIWVKLVFIMIISNFLVMGVTGMVVQFFLKKGNRNA